MYKKRKVWLMTSIVLPLMLSACAGAQGPTRVELPQQYRLPQASLVTTFEKRSGRIALIDENGDLVVMDQTGGGAVKITKDAASGSSTAQTTSSGAQIGMSYRWPVWSPDASQIAFVELTAAQPAASRIIEIGADAIMLQHGDNSVITLQNEQGQVSERPTDPTTVIRQPGRVIIERDTTPTVLASSVFVARSDGKTPLREMYASDKGAIAYLDWSPDNSQLAFLAQTGSQETTLTLVNKDAGKPRNLVSGVSAAWQWNPDGNTMITKVDANMTDNTADLSLLDTHADKTVTTLVQKANLPFGAPAFSPDGNTILYTVKSDGKDYLALADRQGKPLRTLNQIDGAVGFTWSPVGAKVAYVVQNPANTNSNASMTQTAGSLHLLDVNSGEDKVLSQLPVAGFFWSPDGKYVAAFSPVHASDISKSFPGMDLTGNQPNSVLMLQTIDVTTRAFRQLFYFEPTNDFSRMLSEFDRFSHGVNIWSPDSHNLVFPVIYTNSTTSQTSNLIVETESSGSIEPRVISQGTMAVWSPK
jgi:Tol biopolymer transport system component